MRLNINNERRTILILSLFFVAILLITFEVILPTIQYIKDLDTNTNDLKNYLEKKYDNTHTLKISKVKIQEIKTQTINYEDYLFYHGDELKLINILENLAANNSLVQTIGGSDIGQNNGNAIHISLSLKGEYAHLIKYIFDLEKSNYFIQIERLQLVPFEDLQNIGTATKQATLNLDLILYVNKH